MAVGTQKRIEELGLEKKDIKGRYTKTFAIIHSPGFRTRTFLIFSLSCFNNVFSLVF